MRTMKVMKYLEKSPSNKILIIFSIIGIIIFILINQLVFETLKVIVPDYSILDLEFAWTKDKVSLIFSTWGNSGIYYQLLGTYWDFLYIFGYSSFMFSLILLVARQVSGKFKFIGMWISLFPIIAGIFDCIENAFLLMMMNDLASIPLILPLISSSISTIKFSLLFIGIVYFAIELLTFIIIKIKARKEK